MDNEKNKIKDLWDAIESQDISNSNLLYKRLYKSNDSGIDVFCVMPYGQYYGIAFSIEGKIEANLKPFKDLKDLQVFAIPDSASTNKELLVISLLSNEHREVFTALCDNIVDYIVELQDKKDVVQEILNRLQDWITIFDTLSSRGLSPAEQLGLYGELYFLKKVLDYKKDSDPLPIINSWVGVDKEIQDFQGGNWAVEVKTSSGKNHQRINISSERQLDDSSFGNLFLYHISIEVSRRKGDNLNTIVEQIRNLLGNNQTALNDINQKLIMAGYYNEHSNFYEDKSYSIREDNFYEVDEEFPRLTESTIPAGIGDVKYSIILSQCLKHIIKENEIMDFISL